nr:MAG TPA_asm: hypothetical protein [Caudoviricetes sp.]
MPDKSRYQSAPIRGFFLSVVVSTTVQRPSTACGE